MILGTEFVVNEKSRRIEYIYKNGNDDPVHSTRVLSWIAFETINDTEGTWVLEAWIEKCKRIS